jgi:hypothetical protein
LEAPTNGTVTYTLSGGPIVAGSVIWRFGDFTVTTNPLVINATHLSAFNPGPGPGPAIVPISVEFQLTGSSVVPHSHVFLVDVYDVAP